MDIKGLKLSDEQQRKLQELTDPEQVIAYLKEAGAELSDEQLEKISGGIWYDGTHCPECNSTKVAYDSQLIMRVCLSCGYEW